MCKCVSIEMGSHSNEISVEIPEFGHSMSQYIKNRQEVGLSIDNMIKMDACLENEIKYLWSIGIKTGLLGTPICDWDKTDNRNCVHGSDSQENAEKEIAFFFN